MSDEFVEKKSVGKIIFIILLILVILGGIGFGGYTFIKNNLLNPSKYLITTKDYLLDRVYKPFSFFKEKDAKLDEKLDGTISFITNNKEMDYLNHLGVNFNVLASVDKEEMQSNIDLLENDNSILNTSFIIKEDSMYLDSKDLYEKTLLLGKMNTNFFKDLKNDNKDISISDLNTLINNYTKYIVEAILEGDVKTEIVDVYKVRFTYEINDKNIDKVQKKYDEYINKDKLIDKLLKEEKINKEFFNIKFSPLKIVILKSIGTGEIYKLEINGNDTNFVMELDTDKRGYYKFYDGKMHGTLEIKNDTYTFKIYENDILTLTIKLTINDELIKFIITGSDVDISFSVKEEAKDTLNVSFIVKQNNLFSMDLSGTIKRNKIGYNLSFITDFLVNEEKFKMKFIGNITYGENLLTKKELGDVINIESLSEKEQEKISENLYKKLEKTKFLELFMGESNSYTY